MTTRATELFSGNDWRVLYRAFTQINFNASDPQTINTALREYIQKNYPEDFNDWIESSEFVAIIDLLAWLAGTLAFRTDINARENFLDTAEARESILRLARFLSYVPRRNQAARGIAKLIEISTNDDISDPYGSPLNNKTIVWNDPNDGDWYDKWTTVMNSALINSNPIGVPLRSANISGINTNLYRLNTKMSEFSGGFSSTIGGQKMDFEVINGDFGDSGLFVERDPNPDGAFHIVQRNDGNGNNSTRSGFFILWKQGTTYRETVTIDSPVENLLIDMTNSNINESDVWVQTVDSNGSVISNWTKIPAIFSENITFNSINKEIRNIFSVITRDNDKISIRFSDGIFGTAPVGIIRTTYRVSNGLQYQIRPSEMSRINVPITYYNRRGVAKILRLTFSLQETVANSAARETEEQIRDRAPSAFASQNRMVSGEDYNTFPLQSNLVVKMKAVNRVYSGHSRFIDLHDPTSTYQNTNVFADDGIFYKDPYIINMEIPDILNKTLDQLFYSYIQPAVQTQEVSNYVRDQFYSFYNNISLQPVNIVWNSVDLYPTTGWFSGNSSLISIGSICLFLYNGQKTWATITNISGPVNLVGQAGRPGTVTFGSLVPSGSLLITVIPKYSGNILPETIIEIKNKLANNESFSLWYDYADSTWEVTQATPINVQPLIIDTRVKILTMNYFSALWRILASGTRYIFESHNQVKWFFESGKVIDPQTGLQKRDIIKILKINPDALTGYPLQSNYDLAIDNTYRYSDGYADPNKIVVRLNDSIVETSPDFPDLFYKVLGYSVGDFKSYLFWQKQSDDYYVPYTGMIIYEQEADRNIAIASEGMTVFQINSANSINKNTFWIYKSGTWTQDRSNWKYAIGRGPNIASRSVKTGGAIENYTPVDSLFFQWKHFANTAHRIDPASTNIIDIFVLTSEYDFKVRQWLKTGADIRNIPEQPSDLDLRLAFSEYEQYRIFSDQIIWRPVKYKFLFGASAEPELQTQFKIVRLSNSSLSDGEIKSKVIKTINDYFDSTRWDFGETFYYTELAAYLHQQLANMISSVVIVPIVETSSFGNVFEVKCRTDEIFLSTAQIDNVIIINSNTSSNLRIK